MSYTSIKARNTNTILFEGTFPNTRRALEAAVEMRISLENADLRGQNLAGSNLDDALLTGADFTGSNLSGANLSEALLKNAILVNTTLADTCFNQSNLSGVDFRGARFGATDIVETNLNNTLFSDASCFSLNFIESISMQGANYIHHDNQTYAMSLPPKIMTGVFNRPIAMLDDHLIIGNQVFPLTAINTNTLLSLR